METKKEKEGDKKEEDKKESISIQQDMEQKEEEQRHNRGVLAKSTGGGFGTMNRCSKRSKRFSTAMTLITSCVGIYPANRF